MTSARAPVLRVFLFPAGLSVLGYVAARARRRVPIKSQNAIAIFKRLKAIPFKNAI
jgi:hypothetical protein